MESIKLNAQNLSKLADRVAIPSYDRTNVKAGIVHVGIGGFHRSHQALYTDLLLHEKGNENWGICGVALLDFDRKIFNTLKEQDGLYTLIVKELDGSHTATVIGSIIEVLYAPENPHAVIEKMASPETKIISLTITEGGYNFNEATKQFDFNNPLVQHDIKYPSDPKTIFGYLTQALKLRKERGQIGLALQSCDNVQGNGHMLQNMLLSFVEKAEPGLVDWIKKEISFPNSMVDRITPATNPNDVVGLKTTTGIDDAWPVVCEPFKQWVIEDDFVVGRPAWEKVGAQFVLDVLPYEKMKLTLLNAGHSVLGILGALKGYATIDEAVADAGISRFLRVYMDHEVTPTLGDLEGVDLRQYKDSLIQRFGNINIKDQIERICSETSAKLPIFVFPTVHAQLKTAMNVNLASFVIAAWAVYSLGLDENGNKIIIKDALSHVLQDKALKAKDNPEVFLEIDAIFGNLKNEPLFVDSFKRSYQAISENGIEKAVLEVSSTVLNKG